MTVVMIIGFILSPFAWVFMTASNEAHKNETGVNAPTRSRMNSIRRKARKNGISEQAAYSQRVPHKL